MEESVYEVIKVILVVVAGIGLLLSLVMACAMVGAFRDDAPDRIRRELQMEDDKDQMEFLEQYRKQKGAKRRAREIRQELRRKRVRQSLHGKEKH